MKTPAPYTKRQLDAVIRQAELTMRLCTEWKQQDRNLARERKVRDNSMSVLAHKELE